MRAASLVLLLSCILCVLCMNYRDKAVTSLYMVSDYTRPLGSSIITTLGAFSQARNTTIKWRDTVDYYGKTYGLTVSADKAPDGFEWALYSGEFYDMYAFNGPVRPEGIGMTDIGVFDDTAILMAQKDVKVYGKYGGPNGTVIPAGSWLIYGYYVYYFKSNGSAAFPPTKYYAEMPMTWLNYGLDFEIGCMLENPLFGNGLSKGYMKLYVQGPTLRIRITNHQIFGASATQSVCRSITRKRPYLPNDDDFVLKWNDVLLTAIRKDMTPPPRMARAGAMFHAAIADAVSSCKSRCSKAAQTAAISYAGHAVLSSIFPNMQDNCFDEALFAAIEGLDSDEVKTGRKIGLQKAQSVISDRTGDGSTTPVNYVPASETATNAYIPTPPNDPRVPDLPHWPGVDTFAISDPTSFLVPPPVPGDAAFESAYQEILQKGERDTSQRTPDEEIQARFWADGGGTATPPGHANMIAKHILRQTGQNNNPKRNAVIFKLLNYAAADAAIVAWTFKMTYKTVRPVSVATRRNPTTRWRSLLPTPTHPDYVSGHSTFSSATAQMLYRLLGTNDITFQVDSDNMDLRYLPRTFTNVTSFAEESGKSRIYGGIHFEFANVAGKNAGRQVAEEIFNKLCKNRKCITSLENEDDD